MRFGSLRYWLVVAVLAAVYFGSAKLGLTMAFVAEQVTPVWPPTGIALTAVLLLGYRVWPGIAFGAFLANITTPNESFGTALGICIGNTLEAVAGAWLLRRLRGFSPSLERLRDVLGFIVLAGMGSTMVSATVGTSTLCLAGVHAWSAFSQIWSVWWLGDMLGDLALAPLILTWTVGSRFPWQSRRVVEGGSLLAVLVATGLFVFAGRFVSKSTDHPLEYTVFPFVILAALRFGQRGTTAVTFIVAALAIGGTVRGFGPFAKGSVHESLMLLQIFMAVVAVSALLLGAAISERNLGVRRLAAESDVASTLAKSKTPGDMTARVLQVICANLDWDLGIFWCIDPRRGVLACADVWHRPGLQVEAFAANCRQETFAPGLGLPGRIWAAGKPVWVIDLAGNEEFPRHAVAARADLHAVFGFPVLLGSEVLGVMEFLSKKSQPPDDFLLETMATIGSHIGQFLERTRAEQDLQETDRRKDEFLAMLAHELRNPLAPIRNAVQILQMKGPPDPEMQWARDVIVRQTCHLTRLVDDLLDVSRITRGKVTLKKERVELSEVVDRALEISRPLIDARRQKLHLDLASEPIALEADPTRLVLIVVNLLNNASKFSAEEAPIWLATAREGNEAVLTVLDRGIGIAAELLPHIFDLFVQADRSLDRSRGGLGIGLTLVRSLVEMHGGSVRAASAGSGQGSAFTVRLPVAGLVPSAPAAERVPPVENGGPPAHRILVVDDNTDAANSLASLLRAMGQEVRAVYTGRDALDVSLSFEPDVVLLDIGLPDMDGFEVCRCLRARNTTRHPRMVALTGYAQDEYRRLSAAAGFDQHLVKPVDPDRLEQLLGFARSRD